MSEKLVFVENQCLQKDFCSRSFSIILKWDKIEKPVPLIISSPQRETFFLLAIPLPMSGMSRLLSAFVVGAAVGVKPWKQIIPWEIQVTEEEFWEPTKESIEKYQVPDLTDDKVIKEKTSQYNFDELSNLRFIPEYRLNGIANPSVQVRVYKHGIILASYAGEPILFGKTPTGELIATLTDNPLVPRTELQTILFTGVVLPSEEAKKVELLSPKVLRIADNSTINNLRIGLERWANYAEGRIEEYREGKIIDRIYPIYHLMYPEL